MGTRVKTPQPYELWREAKGDSSRYLELMREHGHLIDVEPCSNCGEAFRHLHVNGEIVLTDAFGHPLR